MRIGVEQSLTNVVEALRAQGHEVVELKQESDANGCDCCVVTGMDTDVMGIQNVATQGPVIEASGLSADQICQEVESRLQ
ncbi:MULTISPECIES: YkuS family protein [Bacillaceae]|jgi:Uncharacterised protein family (UPF0180)|uniref:UPF0180 protein AM506_05785 n=2 Tax=Rossellomorea vietnamensis TaxID=218284 RepID=A0A0P6W6M7_9BACI|nr:MULTISPECIES: YkuS family protein [Bacillaceae]KPL60624.1 hypothetical protein AM506_05785 [Rossellomorea vietnamensis]MCA0150129.1 YkuS family protein [Rossellomorea vietnamensis]MCC5803291.1 YkuS family protein [Rossellomorea vietnamensis]PFG03786.1 uncharacterized protein UPF0180 [Bacillus sp. es.034]QHE60024.1 hypothetical protein FHE72_02505 [Rossellomorea vietnamensis]